MTVGKRTDLTGLRFHRLTVIEYSHKQGNQSLYHCLCDCGYRTIVYGSNLTRGHTTSCGCARGGNHRKTKTPEYKVWRTIIGRCYYSKNSSYRNYGGRGIKVCDEWMHDFQAFYDHIGPRPSPRHQIDRIDNDGDYEPGNVRWVTPKENRLNQHRKS